MRKWGQSSLSIYSTIPSYQKLPKKRLLIELLDHFPTKYYLWEISLGKRSRWEG